MRTLTGVDAESLGEIPKVDSLGRRSWSLEQRQRIVAEALAPDASVAAVARRHDLNANLVFKWIRRARAGWPDRRRAPTARSEPLTFIPIALVDENAGQQTAPPARAATIDLVADAPARITSKKPRCDARGMGRRGVIEIWLPDGARISVDADVDEAALRLVLSAMKGR
jgi:transposase